MTVALFLATLEIRMLSPATITAYALALGDCEALLQKPLAQATELDIEQWDIAMHARGLQPSTRRTRLAAVRAYCRHLAQRGVIPKDPTRNHRPPKVDAPLPRTTTHAALARAITAADLNTPKGRRDAALLATLFTTGIRPSEVAALNRDCFETELRPRQSSRFWIHIVPGKSRRARRLPLHEDAGLYYALWENSRDPLDKNPAAFPSIRDRRSKTASPRLTPRAIYDIVTEYTGKTGDRISPKIARSTCATYLAAAGATPWELADWLGHANLATLDHYRRSLGVHLLRIAAAANPLTTIHRGADHAPRPTTRAPALPRPNWPSRN